MDKEKLLGFIDNFKGRKVMVIGDIMLDKSIIGDVSRISPEAPVQVVNVSTERFAPGGAANVASNISSLGGIPLMVGIVGEDSAKSVLFEEFRKRSINIEGVFSDSTKPTIQKVRVLARGQQLLRFDYEKTEVINKSIEKSIIDFVRRHIGSLSAVIVSDYAKGVVTELLMKSLIQLCKANGKMLIVDPKPKHSAFYRGVDLITPNHKEASQMAGVEGGESEEDVLTIGNTLLKSLNSEILITRGEKGMSLFGKDGRITHIPTKAKEVYDVTGAGDTVIAALSLALACGASFTEAAVIANHAAGVTVGKIGTSTVSVSELKGSFGDE